MRMFSWITRDTNIDFMKYRKPGFVLSVLMVVLSIACIWVKGFNYGIDFSGGILIEMRSEEKIDMETIRGQISKLNLPDVNLQSIGDSGNEVMIRTLAKDLDERAQMRIVNQIKETLGSGYEYRRVELVGPQVGGELKTASLIACLVAILGITLYIWFRFEWQFALGTMLGLFHDVITTLGLLSLLGFDISLTAVAAILASAGYSVNDTVVTYDRIRENLRKFKKMPQIELLNKSINDMLSRTILTSMTSLLAAAALLAFGGDTLRTFSFVILWGVIVATYSSIFVSATMMNVFNLRANQEQKNINPFGNAG